MDDLIKELRLSGYGTHLSNLLIGFIGSILYVDDICLISHSCFGLQKMLDICYNYGVNGIFYLIQLKAILSLLEIVLLKLPYN